jgi:hypothetical protein
MAGIRKHAELQLMVGMITQDLESLHDKAPEAHEEIVKLTKDVSKLICRYMEVANGKTYDPEQVNKLAEVIISKF